MDKPLAHRLFFGLEIPDAVKELLLAIRQPVSGARWQTADQLHLTLAFLGKVEAPQLPAVRDAARHLPVTPFDLAISGVGCFGPPDNPKSLWAGVHPSESVSELHESLHQRLASAGFAPETRTYQPHITLARFRKPAGSVAGLINTHKELTAGAFHVHSIALFESTRGQQGSVYDMVERFRLVGSDPG